MNEAESSPTTPHRTRRSTRGRSTVAALAVLVLASLLGGAGCASKGLVVAPTGGTTENPASGPAVRIVEVRDARAFQETASRTATPSLAGEAREEGGRARAVGRATNTSRRPGANVLLAPGESVEALAEDVVARALRGAGFRVVEAGETDFEAARAMRVSIEALWMWETVPAMGAVTNVQIRIRLAAPMPGLEAGEAIAAEHKLVRGGFTYDMWRQTLERGLDEWTARAQTRLSEVREAIP